MNANADCRAMTDAMDRYDFLAAREIALHLRDRFAADGTPPGEWTMDEFEQLLNAVLIRTVYPD